MLVVVLLELGQFLFEISRGPEPQTIQAFAPNGANQPFNKGMRKRTYGTDLSDIEDAQIRLPLAEPIKGIMVRAEIFQRGLNSSHSIEHSAQPHAIHDAAVHANTHDAPATLVHHD